MKPFLSPSLARAREVVATEKIRGLPLRVSLPAGSTDTGLVRYAGRGPTGFFTERPDLLLRMLDVIRARGYGDVTVVGQTYGTPIDPCVRYALGCDVRFAAHDVLLGGAPVPYSALVELCDAMGLPRVPEIWRGPPSAAPFALFGRFESALARANGIHLARNPAAGVVFRVSAPASALARPLQSLRSQPAAAPACSR